MAGSFFGWWRTLGATLFERTLGFAYDSIYQAETRPLDPTTIQSATLSTTSFFVDTYVGFVQSNTVPHKKIYVRLEARGGTVFFRQGTEGDNAGVGYAYNGTGDQAMLSVPDGSHEDFELTTEFPGFWVGADNDDDGTVFVSCISSPGTDHLAEAGS